MCPDRNVNCINPLDCQWSKHGCGTGFRREDVGEAIAGSHVKQVLKYVGCTFSSISAIYLYIGF